MVQIYYWFQYEIKDFFNPDFRNSFSGCSEAVSGRFKTSFSTVSGTVSDTNSITGFQKVIFLTDPRERGFPRSGFLALILGAPGSGKARSSLKNYPRPVLVLLLSSWIFFGTDYATSHSPVIEKKLPKLIGVSGYIADLTPLSGINC